MEHNGNAKVTTEGEWSILEVMGKVRLCGFVSEQAKFGVPMIRIDIPNPQGEFILTKFYHPNSLYSLTPVAKEIAIAVAVYNDPKPAHSWELRQLNAAVDAEDDDGANEIFGNEPEF
jgi:hypothetical protein